MNKYTPAPWKVQTHNTIENKNRTHTAFVSDDINLQFVKVTAFTRDEAEGTAQLISAAPDLLAACKYVVQYHREHDSGEGELFGMDFVTTCIAAIAKAES